MREISLEGFGPKILIFNDESLCKTCSYPITIGGRYDGSCLGCAIFHSQSKHTGGHIYFDRTFAVGEYHKRATLSGDNIEDNLSRLILSFKREGKYAKYCAELLKMKFEEVFHELETSKEDFVMCAVPDLDNDDYKKGEILALEFSKKTGIPFYPLIRKIRETKKQHNLSFINEKYENVRGAFGVNTQLLEHFKNKRVILVDDITTTLATTNECSKLLVINGIETIYVFSVGRRIFSEEENLEKENANT